MAEIFQWFQDFSLPLPIYVVGGVFLAIASNADKRIPWPFSQATTAQKTIPPPDTSDRQTPTPIETHPVETLPAAHTPECNPSLNPPDRQLQSYPSISFTIHKPEPKSQKPKS